MIFFTFYFFKVKAPLPILYLLTQFHFMRSVVKLCVICKLNNPRFFSYYRKCHHVELCNHGSLLSPQSRREEEKEKQRKAELEVNLNQSNLFFKRERERETDRLNRN